VYTDDLDIARPSILFLCCWVSKLALYHQARPTRGFHSFSILLNLYLVGSYQFSAPAEYSVYPIQLPGAIESRPYKKWGGGVIKIVVGRATSSTLRSNRLKIPYLPIFTLVITTPQLIPDCFYPCWLLGAGWDTRNGCHRCLTSFCLPLRVPHSTPKVALALLSWPASMQAIILAGR
jgi:hypothetical protein